MGDQLQAFAAGMRDLHISDPERLEHLREDVTRYRLLARPAGIVMLVEAVFRSDAADFYFGDQEESGLAARVDSRLRVDGGSGVILNDRGERNGRAIWGKQAKWVDYSGVASGRHLGFLIAPSPKNPRTCWMHARDYGLIVCNPFPRQPKERREPFVKTWVKKGKSYRLSYAVLLHDRAEGQPIDFAKQYKALIELMR